jgi:hypothetical protein
MQKKRGIPLKIKKYEIRRNHMSVLRDVNGKIIYDGTEELPRDESITMEELKELSKKRLDFLKKSIGRTIEDVEGLLNYNTLTDSKIKNLVSNGGSIFVPFFVVVLLLSCVFPGTLYFLKVNVIIIDIVSLLTLVSSIALSLWIDGFVVKRKEEMAGDVWKTSKLYCSEFIRVKRYFGKYKDTYYIYFRDENGKKRRNEIPEGEYRDMKDAKFSGMVYVLKYPKWHGKGWKYMAFNPYKFENYSIISNL